MSRFLVCLGQPAEGCWHFCQLLWSLAHTVVSDSFSLVVRGAARVGQLFCSFRFVMFHENVCDAPWFLSRHWRGVVTLWHSCLPMPSPTRSWVLLTVTLRRVGGWQCHGYRPGLTDVFTDGIVRAFWVYLSFWECVGSLCSTCLVSLALMYAGYYCIPSEHLCEQSGRICVSFMCVCVQVFVGSEVTLSGWLGVKTKQLTNVDALRTLACLLGCKRGWENGKFYQYTCELSGDQTSRYFTNDF